MAPLRPHRRQVPCALLAASLAIALAGCCAPGLTLTLAEKPTSVGRLETDAAQADLGEAGTIRVQDAPAKRQAALTELRTQGDDGKRAAALLTDGFPREFPAMPISVSLATVDGTRTLVVVEAYARDSETLNHKRLWLFDWSSGRVLRSKLVD